MLLKIDFDSDNPIYMQLKDQLIEGIARGELAVGETLPSVRQLAEDIGINLHTVSKAYNLLKAQGYVTIDRRKGAVVREMPHESDIKIRDALKGDLYTLLAKMHCKGITQETVYKWVEEDFNNFKEKRDN